MRKIDIVAKNISKVFNNKTGRLGLVLKQKSPEILIGVGIIGIGVSTVMACKATLKSEDIFYDKEDSLTYIRNKQDATTLEEYSVKEYQKDITMTYIRTGAELAKIYAPSVTIGVASIGCILGAHNVMKSRNVAMAAAYKVLDKGFKDYRQRVVDEFGSEKDEQIRYNMKKETVEYKETDAQGKEKTVKKKTMVANPNDVSIYARFFDETATQWSKTPEYNLIFLKGQQQYMNDLLESRGHVFLNDVYDVLGIDRSKAGAVVGWVRGEGDDYIDFNLYNENNTDFINGHERSVLLDFNVSGVIYDLI